jgi:hypothetical protein
MGSSYSKNRIYKPIYIVGYPHGGCTILCNMLRESCKTFTIIGTKKKHKMEKRKPLYFGSGLEGHNSLFVAIPDALKNPNGRGGHCWNFGWKENIEKNHLIEKNVKQEDAEKYIKVLKEIKGYWEADDSMRYLDKSQSYLIKTRYLQKLLSPADVYFIFVIRNPYNVCYKPAKWHMYSDHVRAVEQVINTYNCFVEDAKFLKHFIIIRFEDIIFKTRFILDMICKFLELDFEEDMIPHPNHDIDGEHERKFYPIDKRFINVDAREFKGYKNFDDVIAEKCDSIIKTFNYSIPS